MESPAMPHFARRIIEFPTALAPFPDPPWPQDRYSGRRHRGAPFEVPHDFTFGGGERP